MSPIESPAQLVARFLRANNYDQTLEAFINEAGLPQDVGAMSKGSLTLEQLLHEKSVYDLNQDFEKVGVDDKDKNWSDRAPSRPQPVESVGTGSNILYTTIDSVLPVPDASDAAKQILFASAADKSLHALRVTDGFSPLPSQLPPAESPTLCCSALRERFLITGSMSGKLSLFDISSGESISERQDHRKYLVRIAVADNPGTHATWLATAAWDGKVLIYELDLSSAVPKIGPPRAKIELASNPECIAFVQHPELRQPALLISRKDSTFLFYYALPSTAATDDLMLETPVFLGKQNLAPHSNAWVAFTPSAFVVSPKDPSVIAVATSHTPHMKVIIARLLLPPPKTAGNSDERVGANESSVQQHLTQASQARAELALQDREDAAILVQTNTMAPQTAYSTPALAFRPDGTGIWVNGDDGVVRGIETSTGKVVTTLKGAHDVGTKIRCLWAGLIDNEDGDQEEVVVSGGFDRRLIVWR